MIALYVKIPFHAQIRRADAPLAREIEESVSRTSAATAAERHPTDESYLLRFDETSRPCRLRAAVAALMVERDMKALAPRLHGWNAIVDLSTGSGDEALRSCRRHWYGIRDDGLFATPEARAVFEGYFRMARAEGSGRCSRVLEHLCDRKPLPSGIFPADAGSLDALIDAVGALGVGDGGHRSLVVAGPGDSARRQVEATLKELYGEEAAGFLRIRASHVENWPYSPLAEALFSIARPRGRRADPGELLSGAERGLLDELASILEFLRRSPYRAGYSPVLDIKLRICAAAAFRLYARERRAASQPAFVVLENADLFREETLSIILEQLDGSFAEEGVLPIVTGRREPGPWPFAGALRLATAGPSAAAVARSSSDLSKAFAEAFPDSPRLSAPELARAAAGDEFRFRLAARLAWTGRPVDPSLGADELAAGALATFPLEYAEFLLALRLGEGILGDEDMDEFLISLGYVPGIREPILSALGSLGFVTGGVRPRVAAREAAARAELALEDGGASVSAAFSRRLLALHESRHILPSVALCRRIFAVAPAATDGEARRKLLLDCLAADGLYGPSERSGGEPIDTALDELGAFYSSYAAGDRKAALAILQRLDPSPPTGPKDLVSAAMALARASADYADGNAREGAAKAKQALIGLHSSGAKRAESRAHRLLGLCALAQEQPQEGADYLGNAFDLAEESPDPLECILSAHGEAAAYFVLGDLDRSQACEEAAARWAVASFRADWEAASLFAQGRLALERGDCASADDRFGKVRALSRLYGQAGAGKRAEIWTGRSAAFAGEGRKARDILERHPDDAEALWFLAEVSYWDGDASDAAELAGRALGLVAPRPYKSADAFGWDSGFESIEELAVGFASERSYLADQIMAFGAFASGLAGDAGAESAKEAGAAQRAARVAASSARLSALAREERLSSFHPSIHLYLFYRYLVLETASPGSMDATTALSKAFKALQMRASRMVAAAEKDGFMAGNRWNRALLAEARRRKLI